MLQTTGDDESDHGRHVAWVRIGLVINDLPRAESNTLSQLSGVLLASVPMLHAPLAPDTGYNIHTMHSRS